MQENILNLPSSTDTPSYLFHDPLLSVSSTLLSRICLIDSSGKQEMNTATELSGRMLLICARTPM